MLNVWGRVLTSWPHTQPLNLVISPYKSQIFFCFKHSQESIEEQVIYKKDTSAALQRLLPHSPILARDPANAAVTDEPTTRTSWHKILSGTCRHPSKLQLRCDDRGMHLPCGSLYCSLSHNVRMHLSGPFYRSSKSREILVSSVMDAELKKRKEFHIYSWYRDHRSRARQHHVLAW